MNRAQVTRLRAYLEDRPATRLVLSPRRLDALRGEVQEEPAASHKPRGVWYSCGDAWLDWLESEMPDWLAGYRYSYALHLNTSAMCLVRSRRDFAEFERGFQQTPSVIDWPAVAERYTGIEICPYRGEARMTYDSSWYYTWDVASGCVWDPTAVREIEPIEL
jgi:hypothetical protein